VLEEEEEEAPSVSEEEAPSVSEEEPPVGIERRSRHPHLHRVIRVGGERRSGAVAVGASHLHTRGRRSGAVQGRSKPLVAISGLPLRELRVLVNHR
jgi:hypothetical protein